MDEKFFAGITKPPVGQEHGQLRNDPPGIEVPQRLDHHTFPRPVRATRVRSQVLQTADTLINGDRAATYGDARENFQRIADLWTPILGRTITPTEVALCLLQLKVARIITTNGHRDSWVDAAGYVGLGAEVSEEPDERPVFE